MKEINVSTLAFYTLGGVVVGTALGILFSKNVVHSVFRLVIVFLGIAGIFILSHAEFVGVAQIMIYIGGVLVLMMLGIMLTQRIDGQKLLTENRNPTPALTMGMGLLVLLLYPLEKGFPIYPFPKQTQSVFSITERIGIHMMTTELLSMELTAILLLMVLVGAAYLARK